MTGSDLRQSTYAALYERTADRCALHVSSSVRQSLLYEPCYLLGRSLPHAIPDVECIARIKGPRGFFSDGNVILSSFVTRRKDSIPVYMRTISFACGGVSLGVVTTIPNTDIDRLAGEQGQQLFDFISAGPSSSNSNSNSNNSNSNSNNSNSNNSNSNRSSNPSLASDIDRINAMVSTIYSVKATCISCIVLEDMHNSGADTVNRPRVIFSTSSISRIIRAGSSDILGQPFLYLVAISDIIKASLFLNRVAHTDELVFERFSLLESPLTSSQTGNPRCVSVEFMGIRSDDGLILLCQLENAGSSQSLGSISRHLSLQSIVASDPGTSNFPIQWKKVKF